MKLTKELIAGVIETSNIAGDVILEVYEKDFDVEFKGDDSPVTEADLKANDVIVARLKALAPNIPIVSEELPKTALSERSGWDTYWMIDPLDGTKHFVNKDGEFSVNIALMHNHKPIFGVVYVPITGDTYWGAEGFGAFRILESGNEVRIESSKVDNILLTMIGSSHRKGKTSEFLERLGENFETLNIQAMGSSLKMCKIAEGAIHLYPRLGATSEWDTAAAHIILQLAGGEIYAVDTMEVLSYNQREDLINPEFFAVGQGFPLNLLTEALTE